MKLIDFIVCDDIRHEIGNKSTLIGVYDEEITFGVKNLSEDKWPKAMRLGFFIRVKLDETDSLPNKIEMNFLLHGKSFASVKANILGPEQVKYIALAFVNESFKIPSAGEISFALKFFKDEEVIFQGSSDYKLNIVTEEVSL